MFVDKADTDTQIRHWRAVIRPRAAFRVACVRLTGWSTGPRYRRPCRPRPHDRPHVPRTLPGPASRSRTPRTSDHRPSGPWTTTTCSGVRASVTRSFRPPGPAESRRRCWRNRRLRRTAAAGRWTTTPACGSAVTRRARAPATRPPTTATARRPARGKPCRASAAEVTWRTRPRRRAAAWNPGRTRTAAARRPPAWPPPVWPRPPTPRPSSSPSGASVALPAQLAGRAADDFGSGNHRGGIRRSDNCRRHRCRSDGRTSDARRPPSPLRRACPPPRADRLLRRWSGTRFGTRHDRTWTNMTKSN